MNPTTAASTPIDIGWLTSLINTGAGAYATVAGADALAHQQVSANGVPYINGQFNTTGGGISPTVLMIGAGLLLVLFLKS